MVSTGEIELLVPHSLPMPSNDALADFCRRHAIVRLALFGSALRDDFGPESDIDVEVTFRSGFMYDLDDVEMMVSELSTLFGRRVDLVPSHAVRNRFIRREIEATRRVLYAA